MSLTQNPLFSEDRPGIIQFGGARMALLDIGAGFWALRRQLEALVGQRLTNAVLQQAGTNGGASFARSFIGQQAAKRDERALRECLAAYQATGFGIFEVQSLTWPLGRVQVRAKDTFEAWMMHHNERLPEKPACAYTAGVLVGFANELSDRRDIVCVEHACQAQGAEACLFELLPVADAPDAPTVAFDPDPFLSHRLGLLETLFDRMPMSIAILDSDLVLRRFNPTWAEFIDRYTPTPVWRIAPGVHFLDLVPGGETMLAIYERVLAGETVNANALRLESGGQISYRDAVLTPLYEDQEITGILDVSTDATERVLAYQGLEERVEARTRELSTLLEMSHNMTAILDMEPLLGLILDQLKAVVDYSASTIFILDGNELVILAYRGPIANGDLAQLRLSLDEAGANRAVIYSQQPVIISDVRGNSQMARAFKTTAGNQLDTTFSYIRSWLGVPLTIRERTIGMLTLDHVEPDYYSEREANLALAFANQAAVAIENAQLYEQAKELAAFNERQRLARELHDAVTQTLFSASLIAEVLPRIYERSPGEGERRLAELRELTRGALAEMRTLLLELRPSSLIEVGLGDLLRQLGEAINGRARIPVDVIINGSCQLLPDVQVALYRIAQEALNNVAKHAGASHATVRLDCLEQGITISVQDDGRGFDLNDVAPESLGLGIMHERAEAIGASLTIVSQADKGTRIEVHWTSTQKREAS